MKILCCGDVHIGRRSARLPAHVDGRAASSAACWARIVDRALEERVAVVALSGDVVDQANRYYEATGPLEAGIRRLAEAGITTAAVAGNHDHDVFPRLVEGFDGGRFRLLGRDGRWERATVEVGGAVLHVVGWSYPAAHVPESPLAAFDLPPAGDDAPVLGLLHADLDQPGSRYAPVSLAELRAAPVDFWLLGHVHAPRLFEEPGAATVLYPGSPQALDPGEPGAHGAWLVEIEPGRRFRARQIPLSSVRYDVVQVDVDGVADAAELDRRVTAAVRTHLAAVAAAPGAPRHLCCRLRIVGRTPLHRGLASRLEALCTDLELDEGGVTAVVEKVEPRTRPARELAELARGNDPAGVLARVLLALEGGSTFTGRRAATGAGASAGAGAAPGSAPGAAREAASPQPAGLRDLLREAAAAVADVHAARPYLGLGDGADVDAGAVAADALARQAALLLDELLAQKEGG
ncbi:MAG TPA: DNA repair exonuclease [Longimicrobiales bacterium]